MKRVLRTMASTVVLGSVLIGCGDRKSASEDIIPSDGQFCDAMEHLIALLEPTDESTPDQTRETFETAAGWFQLAGRTAPLEIVEDVTAYVAAFDKYTIALEAINYDLNVMFSTPEGQKLAIDTSHSLTEAIFEYVTGECGLSFGGEPNEPPTT